MRYTEKEKRIIAIKRLLNVEECGEQPEVENMHHSFNEIFDCCSSDIDLQSCKGIVGSLVKKDVFYEEKTDGNFTFIFTDKYLDGDL